MPPGRDWAQCLLTSSSAAVVSIKYLCTFIISELLFLHLLLSPYICTVYCTYSLVQNIKDTNISWSRQCYTSHTLTLCGCVDVVVVVVATAAEDVCRLCWWPVVAVPALLPSGHCTFLCKTQFVKWILTRKHSHGHTLTAPCCHTANWETTQD